jgi:hypothetical protein
MSELRVIDRGGARLACRVAGDDAAPALVLPHALGEDGPAWVATARRPAGRYQVYARTCAGTGEEFAARVEDFLS